MLKFGIYNINQLKSNKTKTFFGGKKAIAVDLYGSENDNDLNETILRDFTNSDGAYKRTYKHRFNSFDEISLKHIESATKSIQKVYVHDFAVSDARTALDFFKLLNSKIKKEFIYTASDNSPYVYSYQFNNKKRIILDHQKKILQMISPPFVLNTIKKESKLFYPINSIVRAFLKKKYLKKLQNVSKVSIKQIPLFCTDALKLAEENKNFSLKQENILDIQSKYKYQIIRAMNVLNKSYFSMEQINKIIKNFFEHLEDNGILIVGSNQNAGSLVNGSIFQKKEDHLIKLEDSGQGFSLSNKLQLLR